MLLEESTTYQAILAKGLSQGLSQGLRTTLLRQGIRKFGAPGSAVLAELQRITDPARLERMNESMLDAKSWDELLATH